MRALVLLFAVTASGCFTSWKSDGPWACVNSECPDGFTCDDGVCCKPGGTPACPTLPVNDRCPGGVATKLYYNDADGDGVGWTPSGRPFCRAPQLGGWVELDGDCNDAEETISPRASERCNAQDDDCDGVIDDGLLNFTWYRDADGDTFGSDCATCELRACTQPEGYVSRAGDCDDTLADVFPGASERCNQRDDNCNGQADDPPFIDVENPGTSGGARFDCMTGLSGVCSSGGMQCVYSQVSSNFEQRCVPRDSPAPDVCGDGLDNDCSGMADDAPGCGGPGNVLTAPGVKMGAFVVRGDGASLPSTASCLRSGGTEAMGWLRPTWVGTGAGLHVLYADAPPGLSWDLSTTSYLRLNVTTSSVANSAGTWNEANRAPSLVVLLCGANDAAVRRLVPTGGALLRVGANALVVPLRTDAAVPRDGGWSETSTSGFDLSQVHRLELHVAPEDDVDITFTNRFSTASGGFGFGN